MATQLGIFNECARLTGQPRLNVVNPSPSNTLARHLNSAYSGVVERCLQKTNFNFAMKRGILTQLASEPVFGFQYYYQRPADMIRLIQLNYSGYDFQPAPADSYAEETTGFATDAENVYARWVSSDVRDTPGVWDPSFTRFVEVELALAVAPHVNTSVIEGLTKERSKVEREAIAISGTQQSRSQRRPGRWSTANQRRSRGGNYGGSSGSLNGGPEQA